MTTPGHGLPAWVEQLTRYVVRYGGAQLPPVEQMDPNGPYVRWFELVAACPPPSTEEMHEDQGARMDKPTATASESHSTFSGVTVYDHAGAIVTIEPGMLAGRDIGGREEVAIRSAIEQLRGFIGVAACPPQEPDVKDALLEICRRIEAWPSDCVETHRERAAYSGNLIRAVYAIAEQALAALPGAVPARVEEDQENEDLQSRRGKPEQQP